MECNEQCREQKNIKSPVNLGVNFIYIILILTVTLQVTFHKNTIRTLRATHSALINQVGKDERGFACLSVKLLLSFVCHFHVVFTVILKPSTSNLLLENIKMQIPGTHSKSLG